MGSTEALGGKKKEEIPECIDGEGERDLDLSDRASDPRSAPQENARLQNFERPCSEEERGATPTVFKWGPLGNMKFAYHGAKKVQIEADTTRVAPVSSKQTTAAQAADHLQ